MTQSRREGGVLGGRKMSRRDFLRVGGAGLAGATLLGAAGCGGGGSQASGNVVFAMGVDTSGTLQGLVDKFNKQNKGSFQVTYREMPADSGQYFDQLRTELQSGASEIDVIGGDVIWPAQFAANGWILDVSERFPQSERQQFLPAPVKSLVLRGRHIRRAVVHRRRDALLSAGPPGAGWLLRGTQDLGGTEGDGPQDGSGHGHARRLYVPGGRLRGRDHQRPRVHLWTHGGDVLEGNKVIID